MSFLFGLFGIGEKINVFFREFGMVILAAVLIAVALAIYPRVIGLPGYQTRKSASYVLASVGVAIAIFFAGFWYRGVIENGAQLRYVIEQQKKVLAEKERQKQVADDARAESEQREVKLNEARQKDVDTIAEYERRERESYTKQITPTVCEPGKTRVIVRPGKERVVIQPGKTRVVVKEHCSTNDPNFSNSLRQLDRSHGR